jgi:hypothetical protein
MNNPDNENTSSYKTIDQCINYDKASAFTRFIWSKYKKVTLSQIKKEYYIQKNIL